MHKFLGVVAGIVALAATVWIIEAIGHSLFPLPPGTDLSDRAQLAGLMDKVPLGAKLAVVLAWFAGALDGAFVARLVSRWTPSAWIVVALGIAFGVATLLMIPHPLWMQIAAVATPLLGGWIATRLPLPAPRGLANCKPDAAPRN